MIKKLIRTLFGAALDGFKRFPLTVIALLVTTFLANLEVADILNLPNSLQIKLFSALAAFTMASLIKQIAIESYGYGTLLQQIGTGVAGLVAAAIAWFAKDVGLTEIAFFAALSGGILSAGHWFRGTSQGFWFFVVRLLFAAGLALVAVVVFGAGVSAILASLDYLFGVDISSRLYGHVWATALFAAGPIFALGRIPDDFDMLPNIDGNNHGIAGLRLLSDYIAAPMLAVYALMLHAYALKIIITGEVPEGQIGWMVVGFGSLIIFFWNVMLPLRDVLTRSGRLFLKFWPVMIIVPLLLLGYALYLRVANYGVTPERYFLAAFGVLMAIFALMQVFSFTRDWLPGAAPLVVISLFMGSFGPWGAVQVSINSQVKNFAQLLDENNFVKNASTSRARNILAFLRKNRGLEALKPFTVKFTEDPFKPRLNDSNYSLQTRLKQAFHAYDNNGNGPKSDNRKYVSFSRGFVSTEGYDLYLSKISLAPNRTVYRRTATDYDFRIDTESRAIKVIFGEKVASFFIEPLYKFLKTSGKNEKARGFVLTSGSRKLLLVPEYLNLTISNDVEVILGKSAVFLRNSDWK